MATLFNLQGHRGARGLKPENTLPAFEVALDLGVSSIETDLHLSRDEVPVLIHDPHLNERGNPLVRSLTLEQLRGHRLDRNPDPSRFPRQDAAITPLARMYAESTGMDPYGVPALADLFAFVAAYTGEMGRQAGKTPEQRERAARLGFDLELKRVPFHPEYIGDNFMGQTDGLLEQRVLDGISAAGVLDRVTIRSFDHRCVRLLKEMEPRLRAGVLIAGTAPCALEQLTAAAKAEFYFPEFEYLDEQQLKQAHAAGIRVVPWTVNEPADLQRLLDWGVDGITTDFPDRLAQALRARGVPW
jgi:glycerophosphoryl diester phosphodiesterase